MICGLNCGGCQIDGEESDDAFESALDAPVPANCPQVSFFATDTVEARPNGTVCVTCGTALDEDGRCAKCAMDSWIRDDREARAARIIVDETPSRGPEC